VALGAVQDAHLQARLKGGSSIPPSRLAHQGKQSWRPGIDGMETAAETGHIAAPGKEAVDAIRHGVLTTGQNQAWPASLSVGLRRQTGGTN
jgi:hypothetical protein